MLGNKLNAGIAQGTTQSHILNIFIYRRLYFQSLFHTMTYIFYVAGSAEGFKLGSLERLGYTWARDKNITLLHFLCKVQP